TSRRVGMWEEATGTALSGSRANEVSGGVRARELARGPARAKPRGTQPHLRHRLFPRDVDRALPVAGQRGRDLDQQGGLADAGITAEQQHRAPDETAAGDAVEFGETRGEPRRVVARSRERLERKEPPLARRACGDLQRSGTLFGEGIPLAAGVAFALPAAVGRPAVLADEGRFATGHWFGYRRLKIFACGYV